MGPTTPIAPIISLSLFLNGLIIVEHPVIPKSEFSEPIKIWIPSASWVLSMMCIKFSLFSNFSIRILIFSSCSSAFTSSRSFDVPVKINLFFFEASAQQAIPCSIKALDSLSRCFLSSNISFWIIFLLCNKLLPPSFEFK